MRIPKQNSCIVLHCVPTCPVRFYIIGKCGHNGKSQFGRCSVALVGMPLFFLFLKCMTKKVCLSFIHLIDSVNSLSIDGVLLNIFF